MTKHQFQCRIKIPCHRKPLCFYLNANQIKFPTPFSWKIFGNKFLVAAVRVNNYQYETEQVEQIS